MPVIEQIAQFADDLTAIRRDFHEHPELGFEEHRTSQRVAEMLESWGVTVARGIGGTGVVGVIEGARPGRSIGLRADMDALPMDELTNLPYASKNPGVFHGCGHDGHTTMLLGAARYLAGNRNFSGRAVLIFQPAEEGLGG
ncbi:amidohydrolase, partial [Rhizobiaceae sp. 2RAB30]